MRDYQKNCKIKPPLHLKAFRLNFRLSFRQDDCGFNVDGNLRSVMNLKLQVISKRLKNNHQNLHPRKEARQTPFRARSNRSTASEQFWTRRFWIRHGEHSERFLIAWTGFSLPASASCSWSHCTTDESRFVLAPKEFFVRRLGRVWSRTNGSAWRLLKLPSFDSDRDDVGSGKLHARLQLHRCSQLWSNFRSQNFEGIPSRSPERTIRLWWPPRFWCRGRRTAKLASHVRSTEFFPNWSNIDDQRTEVEPQRSCRSCGEVRGPDFSSMTRDDRESSWTPWKLLPIEATPRVLLHDEVGDVDYRRVPVGIVENFIPVLVTVTSM